jgi:uncharacterized protein (DUF362 family)
MKINHQESILISKIEDGVNISGFLKKELDSFGDLKLSPDDVVAIKPNLCCIKSYETGATTDPHVIEGIINYLKDDYGVTSIYIVESDATQMLADMAFKLLGYERLSKKLGVELINLSKSPFSIKSFPDNAFLKKIRFPDIMEKASFFISVPKIKTHGTNSFTSALKNQFGCNPDPKKSKLHKKLDDAIVDLNLAFRPDLVIVDGMIAMGGYRGPVDGVPIRMNTFIFAHDPVAVDHLVSRIIGIDPSSVKYLVEAERRGIGTTNYTTIGKIPWGFQKQFKIDPPRLLNFYNLFRRSS